MRALAIRGSRRLVVVAIASAAFGMAGCGEGALKGAISTYPAKGTVTMDGKAFGPAKLSLTPTPDDNKKPTAVVIVNESGNIVDVTTYKKNDGAPAGSYKVTISQDPMSPAPAHPTIYDAKETTTLSCVVKESGPNEFKFELDSKAGPMGSGGGIPGISGAPGAYLKARS